MSRPAVRKPLRTSRSQPRPPSPPQRRSARRVLVVLGLCVAALSSLGANGCGGEQPTTQSDARTAGSSAAPPANEAGGAQPDRAPGGEPTTSPVSPTRRKIIYTATVDVVVSDLDVARAEVDKLLAKAEGYVAKSEVRNDTGTRRTATYTLRVPVESFRQLVDGLLGLGTAERNAIDSQDVTEEFVDVQARLKNLKTEEDVLNKLLKESGSRDEVLKTREQIRTIRGDIERAQARLDYLSKLTALSTVTLTLREIKDYKPPTTPTFGTRVSRTFEGSWAALVGFSEGVVLFFVALTPWLPVLIPIGFVGFWLVRKWWRVMNAPDAVRPAHITGRLRPPPPAPGPSPATTDGGEQPQPGDNPKPG